MTDRHGPFVVLEITSPPEAAELLSTLLFDHGCRGIQITGPERTWSALAYFSEDAVSPSLEGTLEATLEVRCLEFLQSVGVSGKVIIRRNRVESKDWERRWRESLRPFRVGSRIVVKPSFCEYDRREGDIIITMDPRMAFGSGHHESTRLSLLALERLVRPGDSLLDAGAGTGILSIAAAGLGATGILAVEIELTAYENLVENLEINGLDERVVAILTPLEDAPAKKFDLVVANIDREALIVNMAGIARRLRRGGRAILSGFLCEDSQEIEDRMKKFGLIPVTREIMGEWALLEGVFSPGTGDFSLDTMNCYE